MVAQSVRAVKVRVQCSVAIQGCESVAKSDRGCESQVMSAYLRAKGEGRLGRAGPCTSE